MEEATWATGNAHASLGDSARISNSWDERFIIDVAAHVKEDKPLSTAQGDIVVKLIGRYRRQLELLGFASGDIDVLIQHPTYRTPPYQSTQIPREVRWVGNNTLVFRCKFNRAIVDDIKKLRGSNYFAKQTPYFNQDHKLWVVGINSTNLDRAMDLIKRHKFSFDDDVAEFFMHATNARDQRSSASVVDGAINIEVRDDDLLNAWLDEIQKLDPDHV